ncbi:hypothetical protein NEDG_02044 [Nematocida displodere]|uniref:Uncharacterized protein n=1 Tax=Nematocida displodere TaxID=1805483 RepID=A0A177EJY0_9MICR|nr:hypothetical protein NEDG_02044 [Nematocida displodere]
MPESLNKNRTRLTVSDLILCLLVMLPQSFCALSKPLLSDLDTSDSDSSDSPDMLGIAPDTAPDTALLENTNAELTKARVSHGLLPGNDSDLDERCFKLLIHAEDTPPVWGAGSVFLPYFTTPENLLKELAKSQQAKYLFVHGRLFSADMALNGVLEYVDGVIAKSVNPNSLLCIKDLCNEVAQTISGMGCGMTKNYQDFVFGLLDKKASALEEQEASPEKRSLYREWRMLFADINAQCKASESLLNQARENYQMDSNTTIYVSLPVLQALIQEVATWPNLLYFHLLYIAIDPSIDPAPYISETALGKWNPEILLDFSNTCERTVDFFASSVIGKGASLRSITIWRNLDAPWSASDTIWYSISATDVFILTMCIHPPSRILYSFVQYLPLVLLLQVFHADLLPPLQNIRVPGALGDICVSMGHESEGALSCDGPMHPFILENAFSAVYIEYLASVPKTPDVAIFGLLWGCRYGKPHTAVFWVDEKLRMIGETVFSEQELDTVKETILPIYGGTLSETFTPSIILWKNWSG